MGVLGICTFHDTVPRIPNPDCAENGKVLNHFSIKTHRVAKADQALWNFWVSLSVGNGVFLTELMMGVLLE